MRDATVDDDETEVPDGGVVRVPVTLMDHARSTDATAARRAARDARVSWVRSLSDAWRGPQGGPSASQRMVSGLKPFPQPQRHTNVRDARAASNAAYSAMVGRLQDAWRSPSRDAVSEPDEDDDNGNGNNNGNPQARKDAAWNAYKASLENAWRGRTNPDSAGAIERQREQWLGK